MKMRQSLIQTGIWARFQVFGSSLSRLSESSLAVQSLDNTFLIFSKILLEAETEC